MIKREDAKARSSEARGARGERSEVRRTIDLSPNPSPTHRAKRRWHRSPNSHATRLFVLCGQSSDPKPSVVGGLAEATIPRPRDPPISDPAAFPRTRDRLQRASEISNLRFEIIRLQPPIPDPFSRRGAETQSPISPIPRSRDAHQRASDLCVSASPRETLRNDCV